MDSTAYLFELEYIEDEIGQQISTDKKRTEILISVESVNRTEFFRAGQSGLSPEYVFKTAAVNYSGEKEVEYDGTRYAVYRTYNPPDSDEIELYVQRKVGVV